VRDFLAGFGPKDLVVQPVIVVPGWYVKTKGNYPVKAMNATYLVGYLKGVRRVFSPEQLETTIRRLDERCRVVEFQGTARVAGRNPGTGSLARMAEVRTLSVAHSAMGLPCWHSFTRSCSGAERFT
jgi:hypothetical protein